MPVAASTPANFHDQLITLESCPLSSARRSAVSVLSAHQRSLYGATSVRQPRRQSANLSAGNQLSPEQWWNGPPHTTPNPDAGPFHSCVLRSGRQGDKHFHNGGGHGHTGSSVAAATPTTARKDAAGGGSGGTEEGETGCCIAAVLYNGAKEVGVALISFPSLAISITQFGDTSTHAKLLSLLYGRNPVEVLLSATTLDEPLTKILIEHFREEMTFTSVPRRFFASEKGVVRLNQLNSTQESTLSIEDTDRYLCVAAANALITYVEGISDMQFMPASVRVNTIALDDFMDIPRAAARALHIICPTSGYTGCLRPLSGSLATATAAARGGVGGRSRGVAARTGVVLTEAMAGVFAQNSRLETVPLVDALPRTCTPMGQRLLRSSLLQPLKERRSIEYRQDAVAWLVADPAGRVDTLRRQLHALSCGPDLEKMSALISYSMRFRRPTPTVVQQPLQADDPEGYFAGGPRLNRQEVLLQEQQQERHLATMFVERNKRIIGCLMDYWQVVEVLLRLEQTLTRLLPEASRQEIDREEGMAACEDGDSIEETGDDNAANTEGGFPGAAGPARTGSMPCVQQQQRRMSAKDETSNDMMKSSPEEPYLLKHLLTTLRACQLGSLRAVLEQSLDGSVRETNIDLVGPGTFPFHSSTTAAPQQAPRQHALFTGFPPQLQRQQRSAQLGGHAGQGVNTRRHSSANGNNGRASQHSRLTRLGFAVKAAPGSSLDVARSRYSDQIRRISEYLRMLCSTYQMSTLRLEVDSTNLFCFSYAAWEEKKTQGGPFRAKFAGGNHFALFKRALQERERGRALRTPAPGRRLAATSHSLLMSDCGDGASSTGEQLDDEVNKCRMRYYGEAGEDDGEGDEDEMECQTVDSAGNEAENDAVPPHLDAFSGQRATATALSSTMAGGGGKTQNGRHPHMQAGMDGDAASRRRARNVRVRCTTEELTNLCQEASEHLHAIFAEEVKEAEGLLSELRSRLGCVHAMTEAVSLLDMLLSFSLYSLMNRCTRPLLWDDSDDEEAECDADMVSEDTGEMDDHDDDVSCVAVARGDREPFTPWCWSPNEVTRNGGDPLPVRGTTGTDTDDAFASVDAFPSPLAAAGAQHDSGGSVPSRPPSFPPSAASPFHSASLHPHPQRHPPRNRSRGSTDDGDDGSAQQRQRIVCLLSARHPSQAPHQLAQLRGGAAAPSVQATANTIAWRADERVLIITGPNAAGKSTLLRVLGQTYTLAQSGCFVPCASASLRLVDRLCTHMLCDELPSPHHSSQRRELMELAEITHTATARSLVLCDELGRSLLSQEGFALAWSAVLWLQGKARCQAAFVTHFTDLAELSTVCKGVANAHFSLTRSHPLPQVGRVGAAVGGFARTQTVCSAHALQPGRCEEVAYGLRAASSLGFYEPVLRIAETLFAAQQPRQQNQKDAEQPTREQIA